MTTRTIICRDHGGRYTYESARGRQPVRCKPDSPCTTASTAEVVPERRTAESNGMAPKTSNPSLPLAKAAKLQLQAVGWTVKGRGAEVWAELTASRDAETLLMRWDDGRLVQQDYSLNYEHPAANAIPPNKLGFDPEELTDRELVDRIRGMKVVWWNTLGNSTESGTIGSKVSIEHVFDDNTAKRLVKFVDHGGQGFRAFHVSALLKVG